MIWLVVTVCLSSAQQPGAAAGLNPPSPSASRRNSNPGDVALIRSQAGCRADRMMGSCAHLSGVSSLP